MFRLAQRRPHRRHDSLRHIALDGKGVVQRAVVALRPKVLVSRCVDELHVHAQAVPCHLHAALDDAANTKLGRNLLQRLGRVRVAHHGGPADDLEGRDLGELGQQFLVEPAGEIGVGPLGTQVLEWKDRDVGAAMHGQAVRPGALTPAAGEPEYCSDRDDDCRCA